MKKPEQNEDGSQETLYRFHPQYGFIAVTDKVNHTQNQANPSMNCGYGMPMYPPYSYGFGAMPPFGNPQATMVPPHFYHMHAMQQMMEQQAATAQFMAQMANQNGQGQGTKNTMSQERMTEIFNTVNDVANGKQEPTKLLGIIPHIPSEFWKGLVIGAGILAVYNCTPFKQMLTGTIADLLGAAGFAKPSSEFDENDFDDDGFGDDGFDGSGLNDEANDQTSNKEQLPHEASSKKSAAKKA